ncbi:hypothetical protein [Salipiger sp. PrR002]|uniref:hypothetical protein n=1 Tax=Salipiger sp. PrR002 TaxID=2706489 RepID=UPI0013BDB92A|nr:hypothetical protein [Salipiger sp. PrR002]NDV98988.1 hypothetical protein [Salipiger sp. PrR002]NDW55941.1 hypothetical protein [Salipiger sp. PrR004]
MAIVAIMAGSIFGFLCGLFSWIFLDTSLLNAIGLYFSVSLVVGVLPIIYAGLCGTVLRPATAETVRS